MVELFKWKVLCEALGRRSQTLKEWERSGLLLKPVFSPEGERCKHWYSSYQVVNSHRLMMYKYGKIKYLTSKETFNQFIRDIQSIWHIGRVVVTDEGEIL